MSRANAFVHPTEPCIVQGHHVGGSSGITLREHFAGLAMQGIASRAHLETNSMTAVAVLSVQMADALLAELAKATP